MHITSIATFILISIFVLGAILSWYILLFGKFKTWYFPPILKEENLKKGFLIQSFVFVFAAAIAYMRLGQLQQEHTDNVIENMIYGLSSLLLFRAVGDFKSFGLFAAEITMPYAKIEKKLYIPIFLLLFILSIFLAAG